MSVSSELLDVKEFIARDLQALPAEVKWRAVLCGGRIRNLQGQAIAYLPALAIRRTFWIGREFAAQAPDLVNLIRASSRQGGSTWRECTGWRDFAAMAAFRGRPGCTLNYD